MVNILTYFDNPNSFMAGAFRRPLKELKGAMKEVGLSEYVSVLIIELQLP